jgi:hypothetical protein
MPTLGNPSSDRPVTDLRPPPSGPAPGASQQVPVPTPDVPADHSEVIGSTFDRPLTPEELDRLPTLDVSGIDTLHLGPLPEDADGWVTALSAATDGLDGALGSGSTDLPWEAQIALLDRLRATTRRLAQLDALLVRSIYLHAEHGKQVIDGIGEVWVTRTRSKERWDERGVARAVIDTRMEEREGEVPGDPWEIAEWLLEVLGVGYVRKKALDALGIDRDPFYDSVPGKPQVTLPASD